MITNKQQEIMAYWKKKDLPRVTIRCTAFNQEHYIAKALESFLSQKTTFPFIVVVHDDASTDSTAEIIRNYANRFPQIIKPIFEKENQFSKGDEILDRLLDNEMQGDYVAICEGDDYWTDSYKLQKQFDAMQAHPEIDMCAHAAETVDAETLQVVNRIEPMNCNCTIPIESVILGGGGFVATNTLFYRKELTHAKMKFIHQFRFDYSLQILGSLRGGMLYLKDNMSVYRLHAKGSWTNRMTYDFEKQKEWYNKVQEMLIQLNEDTKQKYHNAIMLHIKQNQFDFYKSWGPFPKTLLKEYRPYFKKLNKKQKCRLLLLCIVPGANSIIKRIQKV